MSDVLGFAAQAAGTYNALSSIGDLLFGGDAAVVIGTVGLDGHEVPQSISIGGAHALAVHKLPGGARVIDAMGADNRSLDWSGTFLGVDAAGRAYQIDAIRIAGQAVPLVFGPYSYNVVVASFEADYRNAGHIPYRISCTVLQDLSQPPQHSLVSTIFQALQDINSAIGQVSGLVQGWAASGVAGVTALATQAQINAALAAVAHAQSAQAAVVAALNAVQTALNSAGQLIVGSASYTSAVTALTAAQSALQAALDAAGTDIAASQSGLASTLVDSPAALIGAAVAAGTAAALGSARGYVNRALANAIGGAV